jgi:hypothetical protein
MNKVTKRFSPASFAVLVATLIGQGDPLKDVTTLEEAAGAPSTSSGQAFVRPSGAAAGFRN